MNSDVSLISVNLLPELRDRLKIYQQEKGLSDPSSAIVEILNEFFRGKDYTPASPSLLATSALSAPSYEEIEDEPDEILWDFLTPDSEEEFEAFDDL